ncbi:hypothetical protein ACROYT_G034052 [Oculina patagonica]
MKVFIVFSLCVALAWAGCENLALRQACNQPEGDCSCQAGLTCVLTKKLILDGDGSTKLIKQCMPEGAEIDVETIDFVNKEQTSRALRAKRFLFGVLSRCSSEADCAPNFCCPRIPDFLPQIGLRRCIPKIIEEGACNLHQLHGCGCADGLVCQKTTDIAIIPGIKVPLEQCVKM